MSKVNLKKLEEKMTKYKDLLTIPIRENQERFIIIDKKLIPYGYVKKLNDMSSNFDNQIVVRFSVYRKLLKIQSALQKMYPNYSLFISYGYRSLEIQVKNFLDQLRIISELSFFPSAIDLYEEVHRFIAVPTVAGHPTGGAVDVFLIERKSKQSLNFGSSIYNFSTKKCYTFYPNLPTTARKNRLLLRSLLMKRNFAPFDGEWWHFSYGDKEWAFYYKKNYAIYDQVYLKNLKFR